MMRDVNSIIRNVIGWDPPNRWRNKYPEDPLMVVFIEKEEAQKVRNKIDTEEIFI